MMREPKFETPQDKEREMALAAEIAQRCNLQYLMTAESSKTDVRFFNKKTGTRFIAELKTANAPKSQSLFPLSLRKYRHICEVAQQANQNAYLMVKFANGSIEWLPIYSPSGNTQCWISQTLVPLNDHRNRPGNVNDKEPGFRIPRRLFHKV